ncbi:MAG: stalk domain-containing protein [Cellulosilyticaceae bacterium]
MKLRQKLAAVLAATMMVTAVPVVTMAASENYVTKTIKVGKDQKAGFKTTDKALDGTALPTGEKDRVIDEGAPCINIKYKAPITANDTFVVKLTNGEFADVQSYNNIELGENANKFKVVRQGDTEIVVTAIARAEEFRLPIYATAKGGDLTAEVISEGSEVTGGKYVVARTEDTDKKGAITVADPTSVYESGKLAKITITESYPKAFSEVEKNEERTVKLTLENDDFSWNFAENDEIGSLGRGFSSSIKVLYTADKTKEATATTAYACLDKTDDETLIVKLPKIVANQVSGEVKLDNLSVKSRKPDLGDLEVTVGGDLVSEKTVKAAKVVEYGVELKMKDSKPVEIKAGRNDKVTFEFNELIADSLAASRRVEFKLDNGHFMHGLKEVTTTESKDAEKSSEINKTLTLKTFKKDYVGTIKLDDKEISKDNITDLIYDGTKVVGFEFSPVGLSDVKKAEKYKFEDVKVEVPANKEGKVELTVSGDRSFGEAVKAEAVKIITPFKVTAEPVVVKIGVKEQVGGKITIAETDKGMFKKGEVVVLNLEDEDGMSFTDEPTVKVTGGDLKLGEDVNVEKKDGRIEITIKRASRTASTLEISNFKIKLNRSVPEGKYNLEVGGKAVSDCDVIKVENFLTVGTPNPEDANGLRKGTTSFVINSTKYIVNGVEKTLDAAPYVSAAGRTMVPVRALADAFGVDSKDIMFSNGTVIIVAGNKTVTLTSGSNMANVNGAAIKMDEKVTIKNGRAYAPASQIGNLLGVEPAWDQATQTASFTNK